MGEKIVTCELCGYKDEWGDFDHWNCFECGKYFCSSCFWKELMVEIPDDIIRIFGDVNYFMNLKPGHNVYREVLCPKCFKEENIDMDYLHKDKKEKGLNDNK